jgi:acetolactate synthase-1/2/3 large subunit
VDVAEALSDAVRRRGADTVFGLPGGGPNLEVVGACDAAGLRFVLAHGETAASIMAAAYGLLTGRPAMAIGTRGPGATSAVNGAAQATLDRYPLLLVTDCVSTTDRARVAHQRIDQQALMRPVTKWSGRLGATTDAAAAIDLAASHPRGAVHLDFDPGGTGESPPPPAPTAVVDDDAVERARGMIRAADRPVVIAGFGAIDDATAARAALERLSCPVLTTYQATGLLPHGHAQLAGHFTSGAIEGPLLRAADLVLAIGVDTVEPMPAPWAYRAPVITVSNTPAASTFFAAEIELIGAVGPLTERIASDGDHRWEFDAGRSALAAGRLELSATSRGSFGPVELVNAVARGAPADATGTVDAGAHFLAIMPFWPAPGPLRLLISNGLATMGFALPAAIGAALARPGQPVVCMAGDGGLGLTLAELETVARLRLPITIVVFNDAALSLIEIKQSAGQGDERAVRYQLVDFAGIAAAMGIEALVAETVSDVERALGSGWNRPRLIDARIDPTPYAGLIKATRG